MNRPGGNSDCEQRGQAAAYVLGALEPGERERYEQHLRRCASCRADVARLQEIVDAMSVATTPMAAPESLRERIMTQVHAEAELFEAAGLKADRPPAAGRWRSRRLAMLAAAGAMACGIAVGALVIGNRTPTPTQHVIQATVVSSPGARAELRQLGTRGELIVSGMPQTAPGKIYQVWLAPPGRPPQPTDALFSVDKTGSASVDVPGNLHGSERVMVTAEPLGGSPHPTTPPIIIATL